VTEQPLQPTEQQTYFPGRPVWNDVNAPDVDAARAFYTDLFGWKVATDTDNQYGEYGMFAYNDKRVAGVGPTMDASHSAAWLMYVQTENVKETTAKVAAAGGQVAIAPMTVGPHGTMAIYVDPAGAFIGAWQPGTHRGADQFHSPVSVAWNELHSRDIAAASRFYAEVFGWDSESTPFGEIEYTYWKVNGRGVAGGVPLASTVPAHVPSHWFAFFSVPNCDEMVSHAKELGATVIAEPLTSEDGRYATLRDPQGAIFGVISAVTQQPE
jgi:predicted enzyme related to lactoylglutathione lyase